MPVCKCDNPVKLNAACRCEQQQPAPRGTLSAALLADPWSEPWRRGIERDEEEARRVSGQLTQVEAERDAAVARADRMAAAIRMYYGTIRVRYGHPFIYCLQEHLDEADFPVILDNHETATGTAKSGWSL